MDVVDEAGQVIEMLQQQKESEIRRRAAAMPVGNPGICIECGDEMGRLVRGVCAPCRDILEAVAKRR